MSQTTGRYAIQVRTGTDPKWYGNAVRYDTAEEAETGARDLYCRWLLTTDWRVIDTANGDAEVTRKGQ